MDNDIQLEVRRTIAASPERLFAAWTSPEQLRSWWGPKGVSCNHAEVELRVGGRYRLGNELPDGRTLYIIGEFLVVEPPHKLVYTWAMETGAEQQEIVTVLFNPEEDGTEVVVMHQRIVDEASRKRHEAGWGGCLEGLAEYL